MQDQRVHPLLPILIVILMISGWTNVFLLDGTPEAIASPLLAHDDRDEQAELTAWVANKRKERLNLKLVEEARLKAEALKRERLSRPKPSPRIILASEPPQTPEQGTGRCGGDLPPCSVMNRESGGDIRIWNGRCYAPVGYTGLRSPCGGTTASGKWQFIRSTWNNYGGCLNAADCPEEVQDAKARETWANGRGCFHWSVC